MVRGSELNAQSRIVVMLRSQYSWHGRQGDMLVSTSGYTYSKETTYGDVRVRNGEKLVRLYVRNEVRTPPPPAEAALCVMIPQLCPT